MKRLTYGLFASSFLLIGCASQQSNNDDEVVHQLNNETEEIVMDSEDVGETVDKIIEESDEEQEVPKNDNELTQWFPKHKDTRIIYEKQAAINTFYEVYPQFVRDNYMQLKRANTDGGEVSYELYEFTDTEIIYAGQYLNPASSVGKIFRDDFKNTAKTLDEEVNQVILKTPIEVGNRWEHNHEHLEIYSEITDTGFFFETPLGKVEGIEVTTTTVNNKPPYEGKSQTYRYFGKDVGIVKEISLMGPGGPEIPTKLIGFEQDVPEEIPFTIYTLGRGKESDNIRKTTMFLNTNEPMRLALEEKLKEDLGNDLHNLLPKDTKINYMYLTDGKHVYVDFSKELPENMIAPPGTMDIRITKTLMHLYGAGDVIISIDETSNLWQ
ncbi:GerMN domain-containing protein [Dolosigranulum pigrum]|uniref:GerMN domain-containing protein n=1 Tax=Dolosigranulum pigrum TaxID=29394 RepID=UPI001AD88FF6|nr:GerMN domain-containing protein [Dolosigranulum pigrum]QTJ38160.1 GerMN domain-containing protein [Dolosigranulum pigrum]